jgi:hypothetical protein
MIRPLTNNTKNETHSRDDVVEITKKVALSNKTTSFAAQIELKSFN